MITKKKPLACTFKNNKDVPCGRPVPPGNDHSSKAEMSFVEFSTHGLCWIHELLVLHGQQDPEILVLLATQNSGEGLC